MIILYKFIRGYIIDNKVKEYKEVLKTGLYSLKTSVTIAFFFTIFNLYNNNLTIKYFYTPEKFSEYITITGYLYNVGMTLSALFLFFLYFVQLYI